MAINRILLPSGMASGCTFGPSGWSIIDFTLVKIVLWKLLIMDVCFEKHLIFFVLFWFNNIGNYSRLYTHLMTHSRDMFTFFYTWVLLQVESNQLSSSPTQESRVFKCDQKRYKNFFGIFMKSSSNPIFSNIPLCNFETVWKASNFQRCFMHSQRKSIITLSSTSRKFHFESTKLQMVCMNL